MHKGQLVTIHNTTLSGKPVIEGLAVLVRKVADDEEGAERWMVRFRGAGDRSTYERVVRPT